MAEPWYLEVRVPAALAQPARLRSLAAAKLRAASLDLVIIALITLAAGVPRLALLMDIPVGIHGDEGIAGMEARRILAEGYIGPFTNAASGTPTGLFYWVAAFFWLFGDTAHVLRIAFAVLGVATIPLAYLAFKVMFGRTVAYTGALLLAVSAWHLIYSRVAFVPVGWPLIEVATMLALFLAFRYESKRWFALTGVCIGCGIYTYGGYPTFAIAVALFLVYMALVHYRRQLARLAGWSAIVLGMAFLTGLPMASWAYDNPDLYTRRIEQYSVTSTDEWKDDNIFERGKLVLDNELDFIDKITDHPVRDAVDAAGLFPLINDVMLGLLIVGGAMALWRWRSPQHAFLIICIVVIAFGPAVTVEAPYRRTLGLVPMLCALAALPLVAIWQVAQRQKETGFLLGAVAAVGLFAATAAIDVHRYFDTFKNNPDAQWVYVPQLTEASEFLEGLDREPKPYVYFYSYRWMFNYETREFIAPGFEGEDRSVEFGFVDPPPLEADRSRDVLYLFLPTYEDLADDVVQRYPGGTLTEEVGSDGKVLYRAYLLPAASSATR